MKQELRENRIRYEKYKNAAGQVSKSIFIHLLFYALTYIRNQTNVISDIGL